MGERTEHAPGTFSWTDLNTTDQGAAKAFYSGLFGWEITDMPAGEGVVYSMAAQDGKWVGAISPQPQQQRDAGAPPFDVMEAGRMAVIQDPQGAWFLIWQPNQHKGAQLVNAHGALCWNELGSPDLGGSAAFYG